MKIALILLVFLIVSTASEFSTLLASPSDVLTCGEICQELSKQNRKAKIGSGEFAITRIEFIPFCLGLKIYYVRSERSRGFFVIPTVAFGPHLGISRGWAKKKTFIGVDRGYGGCGDRSDHSCLCCSSRQEDRDLCLPASNPSIEKDEFTCGPQCEIHPLSDNASCGDSCISSSIADEI